MYSPGQGVRLEVEFEGQEEKYRAAIENMMHERLMS